MNNNDDMKARLVRVTAERADELLDELVLNPDGGLDELARARAVRAKVKALLMTTWERV